MKPKLILSCEHASNRIPEEFEDVFLNSSKVMKSHRAYDIGAEELYTLLVERLQPDYAIKGEYSRLLIELNRSLHHRKLFSEFTSDLSEKKQKKIIEKYYTPYRTDVKEKINSYLLKNFKILHLSIHSFTPVWNGVKRKADIGLLYDPADENEKAFCKALKNALKQQLPDFKIRLNYPYLGTADGFTTYLRQRSTDDYSGIEIELNNKWSESDQFNKIQHCIAFALHEVIEQTQDE